MAAIHGRRVRAKKRARRLNLAFAAGLLLLLVLPVSAFTLHTRRLSAVNAAAPGEDRIFSPDATPEATAARSPLATANAAASGALTEQDAIQAARTCFETLCDTSIFSFDEYTVSCERTGDAYTVLMTSIYGNGCNVFRDCGRAFRSGDPSFRRRSGHAPDLSERKRARSAELV